MVYIKSGVEEGTELVMNPGAYKEYMDLPELKLDSKIELPESELAKAVETSSNPGPGDDQAASGAERPDNGPGATAAGSPGPGGGPGGGRPGGGMGGFSMPASGAALIKSKDKDGDGKLTKDEAGSPYTYFFDRIDKDSDGFLSKAEADASVQQMKQRMQSMQGGGGGGRWRSPSVNAPRQYGGRDSRPEKTLRPEKRNGAGTARRLV